MKPDPCLREPHRPDRKLEQSLDELLADDSKLDRSVREPNAGGSKLDQGQGEHPTLLVVLATTPSRGRSGF